MAPNRSAHDRLLILQKRIHRSLQKQAERLLGDLPEAIRRYEREYREDFKRIPRHPKIAPRDELIAEIRKHDVTLIGDFHTFAQAQRTALRILRQAFQPGENWCLGLEMIASHQQDLLDLFQLGQISEKRFLEEIGYQEQWGFPWSHYSPIFHWAIQNRVKLLALNRPQELKRPGESDQDELRERDRWAAGLITDYFQLAQQAQVKKPRVAVLYGELHIGKKHLPAELHEISKGMLKKPLRTLSIHQNQDVLYWRVADLGRELEAEVIRLRNRNYCVLSSPPWARLQSVINWAEGISPEAAQSYTLGDETSELDPHSLMKQYAEVVTEFFSLPMPSFDGLDVFTIQNADALAHAERPELSRDLRRILKYHVIHHHRIYLSQSPLAYLATPSENGLAEIASMHVFNTVSPSTEESSSHPFYRLVLENAFGFLGSLIINPRRKCDLIEDHLKRLHELEKGAPATYPHERDARRIATEFLSTDADPESLPALLHKPRIAPTLYFSARYLGFAFAKQIQQSLLDDAIGIGTLKKLFFGETPAGTPTYWRFNALRNAALKNDDTPRSKSEIL